MRETGGATPDLDKLLALCDLFGVTLDELVRGEVATESAPVTEEPAEAAAATGTTQAVSSVSGNSTAKTALIVIAVILGILILPTIFMNPSWWPWILLLVVLGAFGFALWSRADHNSTKGQLLKVLLIAGILLLPVFGLASKLPESPDAAYAKTGSESTVILEENALVSFTDFFLRDWSVTYMLQNNSASWPMACKASSSRIEIKKDGKWYQLKALPSTPKHGYTRLFMNETQSFSLDFEKTYGKLSPGEYRLLAQVYPEARPDDTFWIAKEFTIE